MKKLIDNKCVGCAGELKFDTKGQNLKCNYCENTIEFKDPLPNLEKYTYDVSSTIKTSKEKYSQCICSSCGRTYIVTGNKQLSSCPSCGNAEFEGVFDVSVVPDGIIPFKLNKEQAIQSFLSWVKKKKFVPNAFKKEARANALKGFYLPVYSYDFLAKTHYTGYRRESSYHDGKTTSRSVYISKDRNYNFTNYLYSANCAVSSDSLREVANYDYNAMCVYRTEYLYGYLGLNIDVNLHDGCANMKEDAIKTIKGFIEKENGYNIHNLKINAKFLDIKYNYLYLPIWVTKYSYRNKEYSCYINGATGKTSGKAPKSFWKYFFFISGLFLGLLSLAVFAFNMI